MLQAFRWRLPPVPSHPQYPRPDAAATGPGCTWDMVSQLGYEIQCSKMPCHVCIQENQPPTISLPTIRWNTKLCPPGKVPWCPPLPWHVMVNSYWSTMSSPKLRSWASSAATSEEVHKNARISPSLPWCALGLSVPESFGTPTSRKTTTASSESNGKRPCGWHPAMIDALVSPSY